MTGKNLIIFRAMALAPLAMALGLAGLCSVGRAQSVPIGQPAPSEQSNDMPLLRNGIAPTLKAKAKPARPSASAKPALNQQYTPVQKQDDAGQVPEIELFVGESRVFPTPGVARLAVGSGSIMNAAVLDDKETIIFGNSVGTTSLFIWHHDGRYQRLKVNVVPGDTSRIAREIAAFLSGIPNAKASVVGDKVIVEGDELSDGDRAKITELGKRYPQIVNFTSQVGWEKMVLMDVKVVEFPKSELQELGLRWTATGGAAIGGIWQPMRMGSNRGRVITLLEQGAPAPISADDGADKVALPSGLSVMSVVNMGINAQLNLLEQDGRASILAEPQLSARSGSKASFLAGGEIPYAVTSLAGTSVLFKQYGIRLEIEPRVGPGGVVRAVIDSEVSDIDRSFSSVGGPGLLSRKTSTEFNVRDGETIVLAGLLQRNTSHDVDKVPFLGKIPVLGALFRSKRFQNKETELVVFVTPTVIDANSPGLVERVERTKARLSERMGPTPFLSDPLQPSTDAGKPAPGATAAPEAPGSAERSSTPAPAAQPEASALRVTLDGLVIRAAPDARSQVLFELGYNSVVWPGAAPARMNGGVLWRNVRAGEIDGWVTAAHVEPAGVKPAPARVASPVARRDQIGKPLTLGAGAPGVEGGTAAPVTASGTAAAARYRVNLPDLALYVSPDTNALVVQKLAEGSTVEALPQPARGNWIAVQAGEARGWVASQWLRPLPAKE